MKIIDISGAWKYRTDETDRGIQEAYYQQIFESEDFLLPGTTCENRVGKKQAYFADFTKEAVRAPRERYEYIAPLWLQRKIVVPKEWEGKCVKLFLERVNLASQVWIDGNEIDRQHIELSAPHSYNLTGRLTEGVHVLTLRIDNRNLLNLDTMASGYSIDTQGYWNGIIGRIELQIEEPYHIEGVQIYPKENGIAVRLTLQNQVYSPWQREDAKITLVVITPEGVELEQIAHERKLFHSKQVEHFFYAMPKKEIIWWDEFHPALYTLRVTYTCCGYCDVKETVFGMRIIQTEGKQFLLNRKPLALRGTIDCAQYPLTGYPPMEQETYRRNFTVLKSYGLNLIRFHAWCPPEAAFAVADELGMYLAVEMPLWLNRDACKLELGEDSAHRNYFTQEAVTISKTYGNHPSFLLFSNGNENMGDFALLEDITIQTKALDDRRLYALTSNFDHPMLPCEDFFCACEAYGHKIRIQDIHERIAQDTCYDYSEAVEDVPAPIISFEVGQYCVYPDVDICESYTGNMLPVNFDAIRKHMKRTKVYHKRKDYIQASGDLAAKLYKEDIEAVLRTKGFGGFELLSLCDYTGQSTATVGMLDVLCRDKGVIAPEQFRQFCNSVVPLFKAKRIFTVPTQRYIEAELDLYDYGQKKIENPVFVLSVFADDQLFYETKTTDKHVRIPIDKVTTSVMLKIHLSVEDYVNEWKVYVYAEREMVQEISVISDAGQLRKLAENGGKAIVSADILMKPIQTGFVPVFWSPVHFPSQRPCGAIIDCESKIFAQFPTEKYPDYQWWNLLEHGKAMDISNLQEIKPIVEMVPNFVDNSPGSPLFEAKVGKASILFCGFDLRREDAATKAFAYSLTEYFYSDSFCPTQEIDISKFRE